ncbi:MAG TPA: hypothetical protein ENK53_05670, partial [Thiotrichales bacterium]|nr:hypothetical protein [Thiotrichales bacterium]
MSAPTPMCAFRRLALLVLALVLLPAVATGENGDTAILHETAQKTVELAEQSREVSEQVELRTRELARRLNGGGTDDSYRKRQWDSDCGCTGGLFAKLADPFFDSWEGVIRGGVHTWSVANDMILRLSDVIGMLADGIGGTTDLIVKTEEGIGRMADGIGRLADAIVDVEEAGFDSLLGFMGRDGVRSVGTGSGYLAADQIMLVIGADRELLVDRFELAARGQLDNPGPCCKVGDPIRPGIRWMGPQSREWFRRKVDYYAGFL